MLESYIKDNKSRMLISSLNKEGEADKSHSNNGSYGEKIITKLNSITFLEQFMPENIVLSYRSELVNNLVHCLKDLIFETKLAVKIDNRESPTS